MKFQLVLQFSTAEMEQFDKLAALERDLLQSLPSTSKVDGHDFGSGEFNIFIVTDQPREAFDAARTVIKRRSFTNHLKAAYRQQGKDEYVILWPAHLKQLRVV